MQRLAAPVLAQTGKYFRFHAVRARQIHGVLADFHCIPGFHRIIGMYFANVIVRYDFGAVNSWRALCPYIGPKVA